MYLQSEVCGTSISLTNQNSAALSKLNLPCLFIGSMKAGYVCV